MQKLQLRMALTLGVAVLTGCASMEQAPPSSTTVMSGPVVRAAPATSSEPSAAMPVGEGGCDSAAFQQALLQQLNAARTSTQMCSEASLPAARPVRWNPALAAAATSHAADMARRPNLFGHRGSDGSLVDQRVRRHGYQPLAAGESIAAGDYNAESLVNTWLGNERHCRTLMNPEYTEVGASCVTRRGSDFGTYWTMVMGNRSEPMRRVATPPAVLPARARSQAVAPKAKAAPLARASKPTAKPARTVTQRPAAR